MRRIFRSYRTKLTHCLLTVDNSNYENRTLNCRLKIIKRNPVGYCIDATVSIRAWADEKLGNRVNFPQRKTRRLTVDWIVFIGVDNVTVIVKESAGNHYAQVLLFDFKQLLDCPFGRAGLRYHLDHYSLKCAARRRIRERDVEIDILRIG